MIDLLPPKMDVKVNVKIRLNILAGVLDELTKACGISIESDLRKGIVDRDVIQQIIVSFYDAPKHVCGQIIFDIDWKRFEFLARTDEGKVLYSNIDTSKNLSSQLDKTLYDAVKVYVNRTKRKYKVKKVECSFVYNEKYRKTDAIHDAARKYMGHRESLCDDEIVQDTEFSDEITAAFQGLDGLLNVKFRL